jgi:hypothetical protein
MNRSTFPSLIQRFDYWSNSVLAHILLLPTGTLSVCCFSLLLRP